MKKVRIVLSSLACIAAIGAAFATTKPFVATQIFRLDPAKTGLLLVPHVIVAPGYSCATDPNQDCTETWNVDAFNNPTTAVAGTKVLNKKYVP